VSLRAEPDLRLFLTTLAEGDSALLKLVLDSVADGVTIANASGEVVYQNPAARAILGIPADGSPGDVPELFYLNDFSGIPADEVPLARALRGEQTCAVEIFARGPLLADGALISLDARPIREPDGRVVGGLAVFHDVGARKRAEDELRTANTKLGSWIGELERRAMVAKLTNEMADLLLSCRSTKEFYQVVTSFAGRIFEREPGNMFLVNASRSAIELVASWGGGAPTERIFAPDACWALRRGRMHQTGGDSLGPDCDHAPSGGTPGYRCIPMMGQGEALGVLHVHAHPEERESSEFSAAVADQRLRATVSVAEHIALALANLKLRETLRMQAIRDPLTGLFNRRYMEESLEREIARATRSGGSVAAVMIDLDHFKRFNDTFGHAAADVALRETAVLIRATIRADDIACRFGGEELVVILPDSTAQGAGTRAETLRAAIAGQQLRFHGTAIGTVTASFGVAAFPAHSTNAESLLRAADEALYDAKNAGRNRVSVKPLLPRESVAPRKLTSLRPTAAR